MGSFFIIFFVRGLGFRDLRSLQGLALGDLGFTGQCFFPVSGVFCSVQPRGSSWTSESAVCVVFVLSLFF